MSLHSSPLGPIPEETARVAHAAFPKGNVYMQMRDVLGSLYDDGQFADLFAHRGRPVESPWRLALVTVMQFAEGLCDRQAAEAVRARIDWKYALALDLDDAGFDFSVLCEFRARLVQASAEVRLLDVVLERCKERGYLKARGRQRTDSTHVLGAMRVLGRLEHVAETLRATLNALAREAPNWLRAQVVPEWYERDGRRVEEYRLPKGQDARQAYASQVGRDGYALLQSLADEQAPPGARQLPEVAVLRQVWQQQFVTTADGQVQLCDLKAVPSATECLESPYETEARFATKRGMHWVGYKVHLTETCDDDAPHLVTQVHTTSAPASDVGQLTAIQEALAQRALLPSEQLVDAGYVRASHVLSSRNQYDIDLVGPVDDDHQWQGRLEQGFVTECFHLDWDHQVAICPAGHPSRRWFTTLGPGGRAMSRVVWDRRDCLCCPSRTRSTRATTGARRLLLPPRADYEVLIAGRRRQATEDFQRRYARRAGIEGTLSQAVRSLGLRRARYRGLAKTHLQEVVTAATLDIARIAHGVSNVPLAATRCSQFSRLGIA